MLFLPFEKLTYTTLLSENEICNRINCLTKASRAFRSKYYPEIKISEYEGEVIGATFDLRRAIWYRNSFLPLMSGTIETTVTGTILKVKMQMHLAVMIFMCIWFAGTLFGTVAVFSFQRFAMGTYFPLPFVLLLAGYGMMMLGFKLESRKAKNDLQKLFEAEMTEV